MCFEWVDTVSKCAENPGDNSFNNAKPFALIEVCAIKDAYKLLTDCFSFKRKTGQD